MNKSSSRTVSVRFKNIYTALSKKWGPAKCSLFHDNPFELMVATILSAQCTDERVNMITPPLFKKYPDAAKMASAKTGSLEKIIKSAGFYHNKSANIIAASKMIVKDFNGSVPNSMDKLCSLPGVGRKTANVILGNAFGIPGFPVDTHVGRLIGRIMSMEDESPEKIEKFVTSNMPPELWTGFSHLLIYHGRNRCRSRKPECEKCEIIKLCDYGRKNHE
ncbi:MAG: endonuclease III [Victivallales bacterium]